VILPLGADPTQEQDVCALRLNGQTYLGLHLEVWRGAMLDQIEPATNSGASDRL
jgi:hypothetical protein